MVPWLLARAADPTGAHAPLRDVSLQPSWTHANAQVHLVAGEGQGTQEVFDHPLAGYIVRLTDDLVGGAWDVSADVPLRWGLIRTR